MVGRALRPLDCSFLVFVVSTVWEEKGFQRRAWVDPHRRGEPPGTWQPRLSLGVSGTFQGESAGELEGSGYPLLTPPAGPSPPIPLGCPPR